MLKSSRKTVEANKWRGRLVGPSSRLSGDGGEEIISPVDLKLRVYRRPGGFNSHWLQQSSVLVARHPS